MKIKDVLRNCKERKRRLAYKDLLEPEDDEATLRQELIDYFNSPQGQEDLDFSPHKGRPVESVVEDLVKEILAVRERRKNGKK